MNIKSLKSANKTWLRANTWLVHQVIVIDFGKATGVDKGKHYDLLEVEKSEYTRKFPHMAPEVIEGCLERPS